MSNIDATRVMSTPMPGGATATIQMPAGADAFRTQMGGTTTCPVCKSTTPLLDLYCGDCGYLLSSPPVETDGVDGGIALPSEDAPAAELVDEQTSRRFRLRLGVNTVGRQGTDILSAEGTVSRNHATVTINESGIVVEDLGSSNGTKVGDVRLQPNTPVAAKPGDTIRFGTWKLRLEAGVGAIAAGADQTIMAVADDKTVVLGRSQTAAEEEKNSEPLSQVELAPGIAMLKKLEGICDDITILEGMMSLGRKSGNAVVLADPYLSGRHAEIFAEPSGVYLIDIGSTNGTLVNGQKLEPNDRQLLLDGDEVQLGQTKYRFITVSLPASSPEASSESVAHVASPDESDDDANHEIDHGNNSMTAESGTESDQE